MRRVVDLARHVSAANMRISRQVEAALLGVTADVARLRMEEGPQEPKRERFLAEVAPVIDDVVAVLRPESWWKRRAALGRLKARRK